MFLTEMYSSELCGSPVLYPIINRVDPGPLGLKLGKVSIKQRLVILGKQCVLEVIVLELTRSITKFITNIKISRKMVHAEYKRLLYKAVTIIALMMASRKNARKVRNSF